MRIEFRKATTADVEVYYQWATDELVRENSYEQGKISLQNHIDWFNQKLNSPDCFFYFFTGDQIPAGQVRIEKKGDEFVIGISIDSKFRGKGLGSTMLNMACDDFFSKFPAVKIFAYIKDSNKPSYHIFKKANFAGDQPVIINGVESIKLHKYKVS